MVLRYILACRVDVFDRKIVISHLDFDFVKGAKVCNSKSNTKSNSRSNTRHQNVRDHKSMLGLLALVHIYRFA